MLIERDLFRVIQKKLSTGKAILILGPRQVGKSTLMKEIGSTFSLPILHLDGNLYAYEFKWNRNKKVRPSRVFTDAYPEATFALISPANYQEF